MVKVVAEEEVCSGVPETKPSCSSAGFVLPSSAASHHCCCCCRDHDGEASVGFSIDENRRRDLKRYFYPYKQLTTNNSKQPIKQQSQAIIL